MSCVMIVLECKYNPERDLKAVEPFGFVDLKESFINNCVPSQAPDAESDYNGIQDPSSILGKPSDVFDALRMAQDIEKRQADNYDKEEKP